MCVPAHDDVYFQCMQLTLNDNEARKLSQSTKKGCQRSCLFDASVHKYF